MSADVFDAFAIARRVFDAEQAAIEEPHDLPPLARAEGMTVTGGGDGRGRPVPTQAVGTAEDIFDRLERQRADKAIRSPFGDHPVVHFVADVEADPDRFVAPDLDDDEDIPADIVTDIEPAYEDVERASPQVSAVPTPSQTDTEKDTAKAETTPAVDVPHQVSDVPHPPAHDPRCGQPLTGGGAPRGWVLVRVIGQGQPRRYCSPTCAVTALTAPPQRSENVQPRTETVRSADTSRPRRRPRTSNIDAAEIIRRYRAGATTREIADAGLASLPTIKRVINAAAEAGTVDKRDDRTTNSGSHRKEYDPQLVARVRALYTLHKLTQAEVAEAIGSSAKVVQNIMARHGIEARPPANHTNHGHAAANNSKAIADRLRALGVTSRDVKVWAHGAGLLPVIQRGTAPARLVDAYLAAHTNGAHTA